MQGIAWLPDAGTFFVQKMAALLGDMMLQVL
jgi:hypothetical protein